MDMKELATKAMSSTMAEIMKNNPVKDRHSRMSWLPSIMAKNHAGHLPIRRFHR